MELQADEGEADSDEYDGKPKYSKKDHEDAYYKENELKKRNKNLDLD